MKKEISFVQRLTTSLLTNQAITEKEADSLVTMFHDRAKGRVDNFILDEGMAEREELLKGLSDVYQVPYFDVNGYFFEHELLHTFPKDVLISKGIIPLQVDELTDLEIECLEHGAAGLTINDNPRCIDH